jgi:transposase
MNTLAAVRHNPIRKAFYARLRAVRKAPKVALTACVRKLLTAVSMSLLNGFERVDRQNLFSSLIHCA